MEIKDALSISEMAMKWVGAIINREEAHKKKEEEALKSIMSSLFQTTIYMKKVLDSDELRSHETEHELGRMWYETSILVRPYNPDLAERCFFKGLFWGNRDRFSEQELIDRKMKLYHIEEAIAKAIKSI